MKTYEIKYGENKITFCIKRKNVKNVNLNIRITGEVIVTAKEEVPLDFIMAFVERKSSWIIKQTKYYKNHESENISEKEFVSGETIKYLGKQYRLKVFESTEENVKYFRGYIHLYVYDKTDYKRKEELLNNWIEGKCAQIFNDIYNKVYPIVRKYNVPKVEIKIRKMKTRWGSCMAKKEKIILNKDLIKAPKYCIEYVILHELLHLIYKNHNKEFYGFLYVLMPDWKERKRILDEEVIMTL
ncbi:M48 family metallopeptidase [Clostridium gasigenes]|uniref:M48 family metallopeptidase n=1 Tax=Clostridium gasigenes TaxID=94869 RepID=A0A7X0S990_9CLOT|nr:SprT family zinc-dependent metalloprotease [Clostridium gasigenes]MBB6713406.1 M48 family metallopeptidase [Clostridium gasigenes]